MTVRLATDNADSVKRETVHIIYDLNYIYLTNALSDLRDQLHLLGYKTRDYFVSPETVVEVTKDIPRNDIVFLHCDMPTKVPKGSTIEAVRYIEATFPKVVGAKSVYCENTVWKSIMNSCFEEHGVPHVSSVLVENLEQLSDPRFVEKINCLEPPLFVKVDDGYNSLGLSNACVLDDAQAMFSKAQEMITLYGPILIQRFIGGREFTVAVNDRGAYTPIERIFEEGQLVSGAGGTLREAILDANDVKRTGRIQEIAHAAYKAVGGSSYGRVDIREDARGELHVLEVNNTCSFAPDSYFAMSLEASGSSRKRVLREILRQVQVSCSV